MFGRNLASAFLLVALALTFAGGALAQPYAGSISTTFAGGNGNNGTMFDVTTSSTAVAITGLDYCSQGAGAVNVSVYYKVGTYVGSETTAANWTLHETVAVTSSTYPPVTTVTFTTPLNFAASTTYGFYIHTSANFLNYTNGTNTYSNSFLTLSLGVGKGALFGTTNLSRTWNGTIYYTTPVAAPEVTLAIGSIVTGTQGGGFSVLVAQNEALTTVSLLADDADSATIDITVTGTAPGVTSPTSQTGVTPSVTLSWTGTPTTVGTYSFPITVTDGTFTANTTFTMIVVPRVNTYLYSEDFDAGNGGWSTFGTTTFALGAPTGTVINSADSGTNSWVTNLTGDYNNSEAGGVSSPLFDFSSMAGSDPVIRLSIWYEAEASWDGAILQSSIDRGGSWQTVGALGDPNNWYNDTSIAINALFGTGDAWCGDLGTGSNGWIVAQHTLTGLGGQANVLLRVFFASDTSVTNEGFAFDTIRIGRLQEIDVQRPAATSLGSGTGPATDTLGNVTLTGANFTYTIANLGDFVLALNGTPIVDAPVASQSNCTVTLNTTGTSTTVNGGASTSFVATVTPLSAAGFSFVITIASDDADEPTYTINVSGTGVSNAPPTINLSTGSSFAGSAGAGFTLAINPGTALANAQLDLFDGDGDPIDLNSVTITTAPTGVTAPAPATAQASGTTISFTGTPAASNPSGDYVYTLDIDDNVNPAVQITVTITVNNLPPTHAVAGGATGAGTVPSPYAGATVVGSAAGVNLATVADPNTSQTVSLSGAPTNTAAPGTATITFSFAITTGTLAATPSAAPAAVDVGNFDYTVIVTDNGSTPQTTTFYVRITVIAGTAPLITSTAVTTATVGTLYTYTFTMTGNPTPTLSLTTGTLPGWLTLVGNTLSGTPPTGSAATYGPFTFTATNGVAPAATQTFSIVVSNASTGGGGGGGDDGGCSTGENNSLWMLAGVMAALGLALRLRRKLA